MQKIEMKSYNTSFYSSVYSLGIKENKKKGHGKIKHWNLMNRDL